jgi:hypothetical protein
LRIIAAHFAAVVAQIALFAVIGFAIADKVFALTMITFKFDHKESISPLSLLSHYQNLLINETHIVTAEFENDSKTLTLVFSVPVSFAQQTEDNSLEEPF